jgi:hypothetical protein
VYEKLKRGSWVFNGTFTLDEAELRKSVGRQVVKFGLKLLDEKRPESVNPSNWNHSESRVIPSSVKQRDGGKCVLCGSRTNLHFDHELPFIKGGTSFLAENIRLLCATHNLRKGGRIE